MGKKKDVLEFPRAKGIVVSGDIHGRHYGTERNST